MHNLIYSSRGRSYRELPLRLFEFGTVYRYEKSGVVHGMTRARGFTQDDAHIYCTREQMRDELDHRCSRSCWTCCATTGSRTSTSSSRPRTRTSPSVTTRAGRRRRDAAGGRRRLRLELVADPGGAAFYGPKISVQAKDAHRSHLAAVDIQLDFFVPELFELEYTAADGTGSGR